MGCSSFRVCTVIKLRCDAQNQVNRLTMSNNFTSYVYLLKSGQFDVGLRNDFVLLGCWTTKHNCLINDLIHVLYEYISKPRTCILMISKAMSCWLVGVRYCCGYVLSYLVEKWTLDIGNSVVHAVEDLLTLSNMVKLNVNPYIYVFFMPVQTLGFQM